MSDEALKRTEYWNVTTHTVRSGATGHGESLVDLEDYLLPLERARVSGLHDWGVALGLNASASTGVAGVTVAAGVALDAAGRTIALVAGGAAVVDPTVDSTQIEDVPIVVVGPGGVRVETAGVAPDCVLTVTWREVLGENSLANVPALVHAPWLRVLPVAGFVDSGDQIVLAAVSVDGAGLVTALTPGPRRVTGTPTGRLELRVPRVTDGPAPTVQQGAAAALAAQPNGDVVLSLLGGAAPLPALTIAAGTGAARIAGALRVDSSLSVAETVGIGLTTDPATVLHVEGTEVHSGGPAGGFSFADRSHGSYVQTPGGGQRWVWYAQDGEARLWSGEDQLKVNIAATGRVALEVSRRMRVRGSTTGQTAGIWLQHTQDNAFLGLADDSHVGFYGAGGAGWGLVMDTVGGSVGIGIGLEKPQARLDVSGLVAIRARGGEALSGLLHFGVGVDASGIVGIRARGSDLAGDFNGNVRVTGTLTKGGGGFTIDHPLAPASAYLSHSFVESPDMLNLYAGTTTTDTDGLAWVELPPYFEALNRDVTYQLTALERPARISVAEPVSGNRFAIRSEPGGVRVCWLLTGVRQDAWARANRITPVRPKPPHEVDRYLHPHLHDAPAHQGLYSTDTDLEPPRPDRPEA